EAGAFTIEDVFDYVNRKLVRRHPHVFGDASASTPLDVLRTWQGIKAEERRGKGVPEREPHPFDRMPRSVPVLTRLVRLLTSGIAEMPRMDPDDLGERLFDVVAELVGAGRDPERELERVARNRVSATG